MFLDSILCYDSATHTCNCVHLYLPRILIAAKRYFPLVLTKKIRPSAQTVKLQRGIKAFATGYLQENMFTLSDLPSRDKVKKLQEERAIALARKAASDKAERERAMQQRLAASKLQHHRQGSGGGLTIPEPTVRPKNGQQTRAVGNGWGPVPMASRWFISRPLARADGHPQELHTPGACTEQNGRGSNAWTKLERIRTILGTTAEMIKIVPLVSHRVLLTEMLSGV